MDYFTEQIKKLIVNNLQNQNDLEHYYYMIPLLESQIEDNGNQIDKLLAAATAMDMYDDVYNDLSLTYPDLYPPIEEPTEEPSEEEEPSTEPVEEEEEPVEEEPIEEPTEEPQGE